jgi:hypothetical protein
MSEKNHLRFLSCSTAKLTSTITREIWRRATCSGLPKYCTKKYKLGRDRQIGNFFKIHLGFLQGFVGLEGVEANIGISKQPRSPFLQSTDEILQCNLLLVGPSHMD